MKQKGLGYRRLGGKGAEDQVQMIIFSSMSKEKLFGQVLNFNIQYGDMCS